MSINSAQLRISKVEKGMLKEIFFRGMSSSRGKEEISFIYYLWYAKYNQPTVSSILKHFTLVLSLHFIHVRRFPLTQQTGVVGKQSNAKRRHLQVSNKDVPEGIRVWIPFPQATGVGVIVDSNKRGQKPIRGGLD